MVKKTNSKKNVIDLIHIHAIQSNGSDDLTPRKRPRKQQFGEYPQGGKKFQIDLDAHIQSEQQTTTGTTLNDQGVTISFQNATPIPANTSAATNLTNRNAVKTNNENSPPKFVDFYIKRPKACNLLDVSSINAFNFYLKS